MRGISAESKSRPSALRESDLWPTLRAFWHPVAYSREVGDRPLAVKLLDEREDLSTAMRPRLFAANAAALYDL